MSGNVATYDSTTPPKRKLLKVKGWVRQIGTLRRVEVRCPYCNAVHMHGITDDMFNGGAIRATNCNREYIVVL